MNLTLYVYNGFCEYFFDGEISHHQKNMATKGAEFLVFHSLQISSLTPLVSHK